MKTKTIPKIILFILILSGVLTFDFIFLSRINQEQQELIKIKKEIANESSKNVQSSDVKNKIEQLEKINQRIDRVLIREDNAVSFITLIENVASTTGSTINIQSTNFDKSQEDNKFGVLNMTIQISGNWQQVTNFLTLVEALPYLITVDPSRFSAKNSEGGVVWGVNLSLNGLTN